MGVHDLVGRAMFDFNAMRSQWRVATESRRAAACLLAVALGLSCMACSSTHYLVNEPLRTDRSKSGYAIRNLQAADNSDSLLLVAAFSGGGYRAAAMAYAVMEVLDETHVHWEGHDRTLLKELDAISAVSGGSLAAAYFALNPDDFLTRFRSQVLDFDMQGALLRRLFSPAGLWRQSSPTYGRGDLLQEVLDEQVFHGSTFEDLRRQRPMVSINATNLRFGERFEFSQDQFDHLCSDLGSFPLARAVAASMSVPLLMSPITLWNHKATCPMTPTTVPVRGHAADSRYLHLVDGGLADNTGLHSVLDNVAVNGGVLRAGRANGFRGVRKRVFLVVNAQVNADEPEDQSPDTPGLFRQLRSVVDVPIDRHTVASLQLLNEAVRHWRDEVRTVAMDGADSFTVIEISMARARDGKGGDAVRQIPTGLVIEADQIDTIRRFVRRELDLNPEWQALLLELQRQRGETSASTAPFLGRVLRVNEVMAEH